MEAVGIEPYAPRYANPTRILGFPAYRGRKHTTCALVTMWSPSISAWAMKAMAFALVSPVAGGRAQGVHQVKHAGRLA